MTSEWQHLDWILYLIFEVIHVSLHKKLKSFPRKSSKANVGMIARLIVDFEPSVNAKNLWVNKLYKFVLLKVMVTCVLWLVKRAINTIWAWFCEIADTY